MMPINNYTKTILGHTKRTNSKKLFSFIDGKRLKKESHIPVLIEKGKTFEKAEDKAVAPARQY